MLSSIINTLRVLGPWSLLPVFVYLILETSIFLGLFLPAEVVVIFVGALAGQNIVNPPSAFAVVIVATITGDLLGYFVGRRYGAGLVAIWPWLRRRYLRHEAYLKAHLERRGVLTILVARVSGMGQAFVPFICGLSKVKLRHFAAMAMIAESVWAGSLCLVGYLLGHNWRVVDIWLAPIGGGVMVLLVLIVMFALWRWRPSGRSTA